ncbi:MAG: alpha/beta hydrolase [Methylibium sp.]|uniref:alpha/beta hydrolase n=1 Tax=Methylibium sp. TaxID=2067992 RepID=UPI0018477D74|nr:alpha/beta hydrolase [Methylibium sp.]MBA3597103.1 alpha/beta hydrolase [Methylibium sp.]
MTEALPLSIALRDGSTLRGQYWPDADAKATALIVHGLGEHHGRYGKVVAQLREAGLAVAGYDQRGHGLSKGKRGDIPETDTLLRDLATVIDTVRAASPARPLLLLGHSMGGIVAARFVGGALESPRPVWSRPVDALALSSPALDASLKPLQKLLIGVMGRLAPHVAAGNGLPPEQVSRDPAVVAAYKADPLVHDRITATLGRFIGEAITTVQAQAPQWRTPTLLMWAGADRCVSPAGSARFAKAAPSGVITGREFPGLYHELFNEPEQDEVFAVLREWLAQRFG